MALGAINIGDAKHVLILPTPHFWWHSRKSTFINKYKVGMCALDEPRAWEGRFVGLRPSGMCRFQGRRADALWWPPRPVRAHPLLWRGLPLRGRGPAPEEASLPHFADKEIGARASHLLRSPRWWAGTWGIETLLPAAQPTLAEKWPPAGVAEHFKRGESTWRCAGSIKSTLGFQDPVPEAVATQ